MDEVSKFIFGSGNGYNGFDRVAFWTSLLGLIALYQLIGLKKVSKADFINQFTKDFFNASTQNLIILLNYNALDFKVKEVNLGNDVPCEHFPYFEVNRKSVKQLPIDGKNAKKYLYRDNYSGFEMDDLLLGLFEDIGCFEKQGLIGIQAVYDTFSWYIETAWNSPAIKNYIEYSQNLEKDGDDIYENFKYIFTKSESFGKAKLNGDWIWFWKLKWFVSNKILKR